MRRLVRWYPVGEPVKHLRAFTIDSVPLWGSFDDAADYDDEGRLRAAMKACRAFHGREEDIVAVRIKRTSVRVPLASEGAST